MRARYWVTSGVCVLLGLAGAAAVVWGGYPSTGRVATLVLTLTVGWAFAGLGVVAWIRWPRSHTGVLMIAVGLAWFARAVGAIDDPFAFEIGLLVGTVYLAFLGHLIVTYPSGRIESRAQGAVVLCAYLCTVPMIVVGRWVQPGGRDCSGCPFNLLAGDSPAVAPSAWGQIMLGLVIATIVAALVVVTRRWRRATPVSHRSMAPALWGATAILAVLAVQRLSVILGASDLVATFLSWSITVVLVLWPLGLVAGMTRARMNRYAVADLVVELGGTMHPGQMGEALAKALHDPSLEVAYWLPDREIFVDASGSRVAAPRERQGRAVTTLTRDGSVVAALVHDPGLTDQPELVSAVSAAAGLALENERLHAEARAHLVEMRASRTRLVAAADAERRRVERNLHDGAQQQMLNLMLSLRVAKGRLADAAYPEAGMALDDATTELALAMEELRDLARGIHPAILSDSGLGPAVRALAQRSRVPVCVVDSLHGQRFTSAIEETAYFIVSESLVNVGKHAAASEARVQIGALDGDLIVDVSDDGIGGASLQGGTGLRGLQDRVDAYSGWMRVASVAGRGTHVSAGLPCG